MYKSADHSAGTHAHIMRLRFAYAETEIFVIPVLPVLNMPENERIISVHRDIDLEERYMERS